MILRLRARPALAGLGDDTAPTAGRKTYPQLAAELKAVLDQVTTNAEGYAVGLKAFQELQALLLRLGGWVSASMVRGYLQPSLDHLGAALTQMPSNDDPVGDEWFAVPDGVRRAIQDAASSTWALERVVPGGNLDAEDLVTFGEGFADTLAAELHGIGHALGKILGAPLAGLTEGLGIPSWLLWAGGAALALALLPQLKGLRKAVLP